ncbi:MAG: hypothetical protein H0T89_20495 [Deltaproteobacteria bacterium]|nr:hypothetical protein [Deltaproteobacteria bacterium]
MPHRLGLRTVLFAIIPGVLLVAACEKDKLKGPEAEVRKSDIKLNLPPIPAFDLPPTNPDGSRSVKEMRVKGRKLLETEITVKGIVTWAYHCPTAVREPGMDDKTVMKMIEEDPTKCERPKFYIGDAGDTPAEKSMWVVDVPRPFNKLEIDRLPKEELKNPPPDKCDAKKVGTCPVYKVGDQVEVTGTWKLSSPHSERNSDGLLVYKKMKNVTQGWESPPPGELPPGATPPAGAKPSPEDLVKKPG